MTTTPQPITKTAELVHIEVLRRQREQREQQAQSEQISAANRNLSAAWSK